MEAAYNFKLEADSYGDTEICVMAKNYTDAKKLAEKLLRGSKVKLGELRRVVDLRLQIQYSNVLERKLTVEERLMDVHHSGEITEYKVEGGKKK